MVPSINTGPNIQTLHKVHYTATPSGCSGLATAILGYFACQCSHPSASVLHQRAMWHSRPPDSPSMSFCILPQKRNVTHFPSSESGWLSCIMYETDEKSLWKFFNSVVVEIQICCVKRSTFFWPSSYCLHAALTSSVRTLVSRLSPSHFYHTQTSCPFKVLNSPVGTVSRW
jgi:hypothetical protein